MLCLFIRYVTISCLVLPSCMSLYFMCPYLSFLCLALQYLIPPYCALPIISSSTFPDLVIHCISYYACLPIVIHYYGVLTGVALVPVHNCISLNYCTLLYLI